STIITILIIIAAVAWFVGGKPYVEIGAEGVTLVQTEEPLVKHIPEILRGEYPPEEEYDEVVLRQAQESSAPEPVETTTKAGTSSSSGTTGSNPAADQGHSENDPLFLGNPTDSFADTSLTVNYLMVKQQYTLSYNTSTLCPNWVAWHLGTENMGDADRMDDFRPDPELPTGWYGIKKADYQYNKYGFDRGHVCPSADRTTTKDDNSMTFLMTNMVPQSPDNNRVIWMHFENYERELAKSGNELYIVAGPYGTGGTSSKGTFDEIPVTLKSGEVLHMNVPAYTWKVVLAIPAGDGDLSRIDESATAIAINVPNKMGMQKTGDWEQFLCSIDEIEELTGYDFFELLPDDIENKLEAKVYSQ
ncbi:MAG: DNA/RNA non-specific endonuclease, partial [Treponema sp.]|nr:DNA/RNA non-specific endonuclease [Treponema sp.]